MQELYPPKEQSAACIRTVIAAGAIIVGKTKTVQFASGENARDWINFQPSFNPRGDGYQDPGCSSAGSVTAISSYDWMDLAIGTDSMCVDCWNIRFADSILGFGSIIGPAAAHGLYGLHLTMESSSMEGISGLRVSLDW